MNEETRPPLSDLLEQRRHLEQLALRMSGHREGADELVQEALLIAIERPPQHDKNLAAWLRGVLRHLWQKNRQRAARSRTAELDPALPAETPPAGEDLERSETAAQLARLVLELEEPYRSVLFLRFYEDRSPTEIAALLDRPLNTVTSQLARALEQLRARLEPRREDERSRLFPAWLLIGRGRRVPPAEPLPARVVLAGALALSALLLLWLATPSRGAHASDAVATAPDAGPRLRDALGVLAEPARVPVDPVEVPGTGWLELELLDEEDRPVGDASVRITRAVDAEDGLRESQTIDYTPGDETDERGRLRFAMDSNVVAWKTHGEHTAWNQVDWIGLLMKKPGVFDSFYHWLFPPADGCTLRIQLPDRSVALRGRVRDADGQPVTLAQVTVDFESLPEPQAGGSLLLENPRTAVSDAHGDYDASGIPPGFHTLWVRAQGFVPCADWVDAERGDALERDFVLQRGASIVGMAFDADRIPVRGARLQVEYRSATHPYTLVSRALSDSDGDYRITGVHAGRVFVVAQHPRDPSLHDAAFLDLTDAEEVEWIPELRAREPLRVHVSTSDGRALGGCVVRALRPDPGDEHFDEWSASTTADAAGSVAIPGLPPGEALDLEVYRTLRDFIGGEPPCLSARGIVAGPAARELVVPRERLGLGTLTGRLVAAPGEPLPRARLHLRAAGARGFQPTRVSQRDGTFRRDLCSQRYTATLVCDGLGGLPLGDLDIVAGETRSLGDVHLPPLARLEVDWHWPEDASGFELVALGGTSGAAPEEWLVVTGAAPPPASLRILPGRYRWLVTNGGLPLEPRVFEVAPAEVFSLTTGPAPLDERDE